MKIKICAPKIKLIGASKLGVAEVAARSCYDSWEHSEHENIKIKDFEDLDIADSKLLDDLAWTYHHHSILEHINLSFYIEDISRGVLQEHARHRIQSISVRSTRYTMHKLLYIFLASYFTVEPLNWFKTEATKLKLFVIEDKVYNDLQLEDIFKKLDYQKTTDKDFISYILKEEIYSKIMKESKTASGVLYEFNQLKKKRNVGDYFKHIVNDNWRVNMVITFNLRSLKNYFDLRDSGAAYFQIRTLAQEMKNITPKKYLRLIDKKTRDN